jgi:hypothetical protein
MVDATRVQLSLLAQAPPEPAPRQDLAKSAAGLLVVLVVAGIVLIAVVGTLLASNRKRREARGREAKARTKSIPDAWQESARRLEVQPPDDPEDDDLRIDR